MKSRKITKHIPGADWLRANSHLFKFIGLKVLPILPSGVQATQDESQESHMDSNDSEKMEFYEDTRGHFAVTVALLRKLADAANEIGAKSILLTLARGDRYRLLNPQLAQAALQAGFSEAVFLHKVLETYDGSENLFFPKDRHWTATAVEFVSPEVAKHIVKVAKSS